MFSQNNTNIISKVPMHHGKKKKCLRSRRKKTVLGQFSVQTKKLNNFNIQFDGKKRELMEFFERSTFSLQKILTKHLSKVSRIPPSC